MPTKTPKEQFEKAKESVSKAWICVKEISKNLCKLLFEWTKIAIYGLDGTDRWIGSKIETKNKLMAMMKNHLLKIAFVSGMLVYYGPCACGPSEKISDKNKRENHLVYGVDQSHFNDFNPKLLWAENMDFRNDGDTLTNPIEFIIFRATQWQGEFFNGTSSNDKKFAEYVSQLDTYNEACDDPDQKIHFATYHLYVPGHDVKKQAENYWNTLIKVLWEGKAKKQTPILDIEMQDIKKATSKKKLFDDFLTCCELVEKLFRRKPLIYTSKSALQDFFRNDSRFASYQFWVASYRNNDLTPKDIQKQGGSAILNEEDVVLHQFTEKGKVAWTGTQAKGETDINVMKREDYKKFTF